MITSDQALMFFEALARSSNGLDPSDAIIYAEERGQENFIHSQSRLPRTQSHMDVPREIREQGCKKFMDFDKRFEIEQKNNEEYTKYIYEQFGIKVLGYFNDLFFAVEFPDGWRLEKTDHSMWNNLIDSKNRLRAKIFYKASDGSCDIHFVPRFCLTVLPEDEYLSDISYEERKSGGWFGKVTDSDKIVYKTELKYLRDFKSDDALNRSLRNEIEQYAMKNFPDYKNILAYWEE